MGWSHPDISLEDLLRLIKGFVDILILASGYRSSGLPASWDEENIKKAIRWGIFFENLFSHLRESREDEVSVKELDKALFELTSNPYFPQGLKCLSSETLSRARYIVLEFFSQNISLSVRQLHAFLNAVIEMDTEDLTTPDAVGIYVEKLMKLVKSHDTETMKSLFMKDSATRLDMSNADGLSIRSPFSATTILNVKTNLHSAIDHSSFVIQELLKRRASMSCLSSCEANLGSFLELVTVENFSDFESDLLQGKPGNAISLVKEEKLIGFLLWNHWRKKNFSYLLNRRTIKLLSGSSLIFDAPEVQWIQIFEQLRNSTEAYDDGLLEIIELLLLGFISSRWTCLVDHFVSCYCDLLPVSDQYLNLLNLLEERSQHFCSERKTMSSKENDILEYFMVLLAARPFKIWDLPPVLVAASLPSWSSLFRSYLNEIARDLKGESKSGRCCTCNKDGKEHKDCELAERIWCLYIFHVQGSHLMVNKYDVHH